MSEDLQVTTKIDRREQKMETIAKIASYGLLAIWAVLSAIETLLFVLIGVRDGFDTVANDIALFAVMTVAVISSIFVVRKIWNMPTEEQV